MSNKDFWLANKATAKRDARKQRHNPPDVILTLKNVDGDEVEYALPEKVAYELFWSLNRSLYILNSPSPH